MGVCEANQINFFEDCKNSRIQVRTDNCLLHFVANSLNDEIFETLRSGNTVLDFTDYEYKGYEVLKNNEF